jgi:hypothetical protein
VYPSPEHPEQEYKLAMYRGEHELIGKANLYSRKTVSKGFLKALLFFVLKNEDRAIDLDNIKEQKNDKEAV